MADYRLDSDILHYIIEHRVRPGDRLPTINDLSAELGVSVSKIREDLSVARALGHVQIKPRLGMQLQPFSFGPAATLSVLYALGLDRHHFNQIAQLRKSLELSFWHEAVALLLPEDVAYLRQLILQARLKLTRVPVEVPYQEHRSLHLTFFKHLDNPFVLGILEAYWAAYRAFGLALYADLSYHHEVWDFHDRMVECVARGDIEGGFQALCDHMALLRYVPEPPDENAPEVAERSAAIRPHFE